MKQPDAIIPTLAAQRIASESLEGSLPLDSDGNPDTSNGGNTRIHMMYLSSNGHQIESSLHLSSDQGAGNGIGSLH